MKLFILIASLILFGAAIQLIYLHIFGDEQFAFNNIKSIMAICFLITSVSSIYRNLKTFKNN